MRLEPVDDPHIYAQAAFYALLGRSRDLAPKHMFRNPLYSIYVTVIDLCLAMFPCAMLRARKGALRLHFRIDHSGELPVFLNMTDGKRHAVVVAREEFAITLDSICCFDKTDIDCAWLRQITDEATVFFTRAKDNM